MRASEAFVMASASFINTPFCFSLRVLIPLWLTPWGTLARERCKLPSKGYSSSSMASLPMLKDYWADISKAGTCIPDISTSSALPMTFGPWLIVLIKLIADIEFTDACTRSTCCCYCSDSWSSEG